MLFNIKEKLKSEIVLFDGGMGSLLMEKGLLKENCPEFLNITNEIDIIDIHKEYIKAGAQVIQTNTFGGNELKLSHWSLEDKVEEINFKGVENAKKAAQDKALVAASIGPTGQLLAPFGPLELDNAIKIFSRQIKAAIEGGTDIILIETMSQLQEARAALLAARELTKLPVIVTLTFEKNGRTLGGTDPKVAAALLQSMGADIIGMNCSLGPEELTSVADEFAKWSKVPILVQPNAGSPVIIDNKTVYPQSPDDFANNSINLLRKGLNLVGGCCGTTPSHIKVLKDKLKDLKPENRSIPKYSALTGTTSFLQIDSNLPIRIIGERINPTGKKHISQALNENNLSTIINEGRTQLKNGGDIIDINLGLPGIDEKTFMKNTVIQIQKNLDCPISIDSSNVEAIEFGLKYYCGKALINSINGKESSMDRLMPLARKYGASFIGLLLDETGIPESTMEKLRIAEKIVNRATYYGIPKEDIFIDCITQTAGAYGKKSLNTLDAIRAVKSKLGVSTVLGVSNISHGLPLREEINATFLSMALDAGLDLPIIDPLQKRAMESVKAYNIITGKLKPKEIESKIEITKEKSPKKENPLKFEANDKLSIYQCVLDGDKVNGEKVLEGSVCSINNPLSLVKDEIAPALEKTGELFQSGDYFLPQLLLSAETAQFLISKIKEHMPEKDIDLEKRNQILLATVKGDIHDIGKNIVKFLFENYGYEIIDMGKDVEPNAILKKAKELNIKLIGLSALMTTTLTSMEETIKLIKESLPNTKVIVGGAILNPDYAKNINADYYAKDAMEGIKIANKFFT